jgi:long-chain fatty acid transport protein
MAMVVALISSGSWTASAFASGFALFEQSASGSGNGFAGAGALAEDASTIYWNPAGMSKLPAGPQFAVAGHYILPSARFRDGGSVPAINRGDFGNEGGDAGSGVAVPNGYFAMDLSPTMKFGLGVNVPFGLKTDYDPAWIGRFQGIKTEIKTLNVNPSIAWKVGDKLALGLGVNYQIGKLSLLTGVNYKGLVAGTPLDAAVAADAEGQNKTDVDGGAWGYNFGALFDLAPDTRLGVAYRSSLKYDLSGTTSFSNVPAAFAMSPALAAGTADGNVNLSVKTPDSLSVSLAHQASRQWTVLADMTWTGWSKIPSLPVVRDTGATVSTLTADFKDTMRYSVGANYRMNDAWTLKMGLAFDQTPVPSAEARTVRLPDNDRISLSVGAKYTVSSAGALDFGYSYFKFRDTAINNIQNAAGEVNGNVVGSYKIAAHVVGVQYTHLF